MMRKQLYSQSSGGEPQIIVEESTISEEEAERKQNESPPICLDPDSPSLNPYLLSPWRDTRKHSLPTPQCTSGITASQVRRLSERGGEGSGPSPREAAFLATLSQAPAPQAGGRRHSVVTISKVPTTLFGRNRRESIAAFPMGATRILPSRRDSSSGTTGPPSNSGSTHNLQLDIMDDIADLKARKVRLKMNKTPSRERITELPPIESQSASQRFMQAQQRRFSDFATISQGSNSNNLLRRRASEYPKPSTSSSSHGLSPGRAGSSSNQLISILSSLTSSATEINKYDEEMMNKSAKQNAEQQKKQQQQQQQRAIRDHRSNSFDMSTLNNAGNKFISSDLMKNFNRSTSQTRYSWFMNRHRPISKKEKNIDSNLSGLGSIKLDKLKVVKAMKETLGKSTTSPKESLRHKNVREDATGTKVDAQMLGSAIKEFFTSQRSNESETSGSISSIKSSNSPAKQKSGKISSWFSGTNEEGESTDNRDTSSICSSLKDLFVK